MNRLREKYTTDVVPAMQEKFGYKNIMEVPKLEKVVVNMGLGDCKDNAKALEGVIKEISAITGQHAVATAARKSVANLSFVKA